MWVIGEPAFDGDAENLDLVGNLEEGPGDVVYLN